MTRISEVYFSTLSLGLGCIQHFHMVFSILVITFCLPLASAVHSAFPGSMQHCTHLGCGGLLQGACGEALSPSA